MTSVADNTKYRCDGCGTIVEKDGAERWRARACPNCGHGHFTQIRITTVCDFCSYTFEEGATVYSYPCADFQLPPLAPGMASQGSKGDWCACGTCHRLIEGGSDDALVDRAIEQHDAKLPPVMEAMLRREVRLLHDGFRANRQGDVVIETLEEGEFRHR